MRLLIISLAWLLCTVSALAGTISAKSYMVTDEQGRELLSRNPDSVTPIASITKLATIMVVLDSGADLDEPLEVSRSMGSRIPTMVGAMTRRQMIGAALIGSDNMSADNLCESYPGGYDACIAAMNNKARSLGMASTRFTDSHGLNRGNVSTARDLALMVIAASDYPLIRQLSGRSEIRYLLDDTVVIIGNTNPLTRGPLRILVSKTGYTRPAGACIAMMIETPSGPRVVVYLHGNSVRTRAAEAAGLVMDRFR